MTETKALMVFAALAGSLVWLRTGTSPFVWLSRAMLLIEAVRQQSWSSAAVALRDFRQNYPGTLAFVRDSETNR